MLKILLVGIGGFAGSIARYAVSGALYSYSSAPAFPFATLVINVAGCFAIGVLNGLAESRGAFSPETRALAVVGFLGGFTTFSAFGYETFALLRDGEWMRVGLNAGLHLGLGIAAVWCGYLVSQWIGRP